MKKFIIIFLVLTTMLSCSKNKLEKKGFSVEHSRSDETNEAINGLANDTLNFETRPRNVLLTKYPEHRLTPIYKVNYSKKRKIRFTGSNDFHSNYWEYGNSEGNDWNNNFMPGFEAVYGYNFVNISHHNNKDHKENHFFDDYVLIKTLYYPAFSKDTLNDKPVNRNFYMVSVYDEDTNQDGFINVKDLRRLYHFDLSAEKKTSLIPINYSVMSSEYDPENDFMYVFAKEDQNKNGQMEAEESTHVFWIDLGNPSKNGFHYRGK